jgi:hypothetical protein
VDRDYKKLVPEGTALVAKMKANAPDASDTEEMVTFYPVYSEDPGSVNRQWSQWTPAGELRLHINNKQSFGKIEEGREYFVFIVPAN